MYFFKYEIYKKIYYEMIHIQVHNTRRLQLKICLVYLRATYLRVLCQFTSFISVINKTIFKIVFLICDFYDRVSNGGIMDFF